MSDTINIMFAALGPTAAFVNSSVSDKTERSDWIFSVSTNILLLLATSWILIALIHHGVRSGKWKENEITNFEKFSKGDVFTTVVVAAVFCLLHLIFSLVFLNVGFTEYDNITCEAITDIAFILYAFVILSTMTFLWLRQRIFYTHRILNVIYSKLIKVLSLGSIIFVYVGGITGFVLLRIATHRFSTLEGCVSVFTNDYVLLLVYYISIYLCLCIGQFTLLGLFMHALRRANNAHKSIVATSFTKISFRNSLKLQNVPKLCRKTNTGGAKEREEVKSKANIRRSQTRSSTVLVKKILRKTLIFAVASVFSDAAIPIVVYFINNPRVTMLVYNMNAFTSLVFVILSLANAKQIVLFPWF